MSNAVFRTRALLEKLLRRALDIATKLQVQKLEFFIESKRKYGVTPRYPNEVILSACHALLSDLQATNRPVLDNNDIDTAYWDVMEAFLILINLQCDFPIWLRSERTALVVLKKNGILIPSPETRPRWASR